MSVFARDFDDGANGEIEYSLKNVDFGDAKENEKVKKVEDDEPKTFAQQLQNHLYMLSINPKSGVIQTIAELDRESISLIRLKVVASDHGTPPLSSSALIELNVLDANDNAPKFVQFNDTFDNKISECKTNIPENITVPAQILRLKAIDPDAGSNGIFCH